MWECGKQCLMVFFRAFVSSQRIAMIVVTASVTDSFEKKLVVNIKCVVSMQEYRAYDYWVLFSGGTINDQMLEKTCSYKNITKVVSFIKT